VEKKKWQQKGAGHRQRLRNKFLEQGIDSFTDSEIIELLLTFGTPRSDCKEAARSALKRLGSLPAVLDASSEILEQIEGIGSKNIVAIQFVQGVARRYLKKRLICKNYIRSSSEVSDFLIHSMRDLEHEVFTVIYLDSANAIIDSEVLAEGTVSVNTIYPREVIKAALKNNASGLIIAHNHPSGRMNPSSQDMRLTRTLCMVCSFMHIRLLDHLIIGNEDSVYSFADHGLMAKIEDECRELTQATG